MKERKKTRRVTKKRKRLKEVINLWVIRQYLQIGCKFKWEKIKNHKP